ncbi:MAG TPA: hypothetical protein VME86_02035 [Acidobacteriaceae bacterium]|nr:hypothetical protein [Acidobacteriaceae bacterium]
MNHYLFLRRIRGPVMILVFGVTALLDQWHILMFDQSWPLYLIALGVLMLAERAAWAQAQRETPPPGAYTGTPQQGYPGSYTGPRAGWSETSGTGSGSTTLTVTPPDLPRGTDREGR